MGSKGRLLRGIFCESDESIIVYFSFIHDTKINVHVNLKVSLTGNSAHMPEFEQSGEVDKGDPFFCL